MLIPAHTTVFTPDGEGIVVGYRTTLSLRYMIQFPPEKVPEKSMEYSTNNVACYAWYLAKDIVEA